MAETIERWQLAIEHALAHRDFANYHEVRYESLILDTERTLRELCEFLEIDFDTRMLEFHTLSAPTRAHLRSPQNIEGQPSRSLPLP